MRTPLTVIAVLIVALFGLWFLTEDEEPAAQAAAPVDVIAKRVEALRRLRFDELPEPLQVTSEQARREGLESIDRDYPAERRRDDETVYELLGLIEPGADLRELSGDLFGEGVAGYYDPRDGRLRVVEGAGTGTRVLEEMILAHELTHALEDQRFGLEAEPATDDRALARSALHEGSATALMYAYVGEHFTAEETLGGLLSSAFEDTGDLPPFLQAQLLFAYVGGEALRPRAARARRLGAGRHRLRGPPAGLDRAGPAPRRVLRGRRAARRCASARVLGNGWERSLSRHLGRAADARAARRVEPRGGRAGAATATSCGAAATTPRWSCAGAGTRRATWTSSRPGCARSWATAAWWRGGAAR